MQARGHTYQDLDRHAPLHLWNVSINVVVYVEGAIQGRIKIVFFCFGGGAVVATRLYGFFGG